jgi:GWxTD domain-containing protein
VAACLLLAAGALHGLPSREMSVEVIRYFPTDEAMLLEAFVQIPMPAIRFERSVLGEHSYRLFFMVDLYDGEEKRLFHDEGEWTGTVEARLIGSERAYLMEPILSVPVDIGAYTLVASVKDRISGNVQEFRREIEDPGESPILSDVVLATSIVKDTSDVGDRRDIFRKGSLRINVSPSGVFYDSSPLIFFYYQIRNGTGETRTFDVRMDILDASGELVKEIQTRKLEVAPGVQADAGAFSCSGLPVGGYFIRLTTQDPARGDAGRPVIVTRPFTVTVRQQRAASGEERKPERNEYAGYGEAQLDSVYATLRYLMTESQKREYRSLNVDGKRNFLHRAWKSLDPIPATEENEYREEHTKRVKFAMEEFSTVWKAKQGDTSRWAVDDRGVIYIKYGEPDERLIRPNEYGSDPYEIWKYYASGFSYLFLERIRTQGHELIYTNNRDEVYLPDWQRYFPPLILDDIYRELGTAVNR